MTTDLTLAVFRHDTQELSRQFLPLGGVLVYLAGTYFRPTSDVNISVTVSQIYLKINVQRVPTSHSSHINF